MKEKDLLQLWCWSAEDWFRGIDIFHGMDIFRRLNVLMMLYWRFVLTKAVICYRKLTYREINMVDLSFCDALISWTFSLCANICEIKKKNL